MAQMDQYCFHCGAQKHERVETVSDPIARFSQNIAHLNIVTDFDGNGPLFQVTVLCFLTLIMGDHNAVSTFFTI